MDTGYKTPTVNLPFSYLLLSHSMKLVYLGAPLGNRPPPRPFVFLKEVISAFALALPLLFSFPLNNYF